MRKPLRKAQRAALPAFPPADHPWIERAGSRRLTMALWGLAATVTCVCGALERWAAR